jgi:hypothetical protein
MTAPTDADQPRTEGAASKGPTPPANRAITREVENANEGYRRRGRLAANGDTLPMKDTADQSPEKDTDEAGEQPAHPSD